MFVSHEKTPSKKRFQKPNILRRKPGVITKSNVSDRNEPSAPLKSLLSGTHSGHNDKQNAEDTTIYGFSKPHHIFIETEEKVVEKSVQNRSEKNEPYKICVSLDNNSTINPFGNNVLINNNDENVQSTTTGVESFLDGKAVIQDPTLSSICTTETVRQIENQPKPKWCLNFINDAKEIVISNYDGTQLKVEPKSDLVTTVVPMAVVSSLSHQPNSSHDVVSCVSAQNLTIDCFTSRAVKYKCDEPNCNKGFRSEQKLKKHKNAHSKQTSRTPAKLTSECPVKKTNEDGTEEKCERVFLVRNELMKHLKEEHTLEEALYRCEKCGRRFFWASGLRAHASSQCSRGSLTCAWPGCGRVFRQPCRLREHARAHTGDRPYPCLYPNCGWSFRSASKLMRHARRHTGERSHACAACGRAFLRREHLRDHHARYHQPRARDKHACTHAGCEQTFTNMSSLYMHMKKVHRKDEVNTSTAAVSVSPPTRKNGDNMFVVSLVPDCRTDVIGPVKFEIGPEVKLEGETVLGPTMDALDASIEPTGASVETAGVPVGTTSSSVDTMGVDTEWHSARTHCTWPLPPRNQPAYEECVDNVSSYVLEEDVQVEQSEGSENNIYTIRSDLFLHGNVLINEDSEFVISRDYVARHAGAEELGSTEGHENGGADSTSQPLDADFGLIDSHPTIDLMQEELMYADEAVDESSFRVFLMNSEELT